MRGVTRHLSSISNSLLFWLSHHKYNFKWNDWIWGFSGPVSKASLLLPLIGYLILFNDTMVSGFGFSTLTGATSSHDSAFWLTDPQRLRLVYFGLVTYSVGGFLFHCAKPRILNVARSPSEYKSFVKTYFTVQDYIDVVGAIDSVNYSISTRDGHEVTAQGSSLIYDLTQVESESTMREVLETHSNTVACMASEFYTHSVRQRRGWLATALLFACTGWLLLAFPSIDLFLRVVQTTLP